MVSKTSLSRQVAAMAGQGTMYQKSILVSPNPAAEALAKELTLGMRFPSAQVVRFCDARAMQLVRAIPADSRWNVVVFPGDILDPNIASRLQKVTFDLLFTKPTILANSSSEQLAIGLQDVARQFTPKNQDVDAVIRGVLVIMSNRTKVEQADIPEFFTPVTGSWRTKGEHILPSAY